METKAHTVKRFDAELEELNNNVVKMASAVEEQLGRLGDALVNLNADEAAKVMAEDHVINSWEAELDDYLKPSFLGVNLRRWTCVCSSATTA